MRALVSGGTKGVGADVVRGLHAAGLQVMTAARSLPPTVVDGVVYVAADLTTAGGADRVARSVLGPWGGADILVNVLGGSSAPGGGFAALDDAQWFNALTQHLAIDGGTVPTVQNASRLRIHLRIDGWFSWPMGSSREWPVRTPSPRRAGPSHCAA